MNHQIDIPEIESYLSALEARLANLPADQSEEIMFGVREHIAEALERGNQSAAQVLASLGSPDDILAGLQEPGIQHPLLDQQYKQPMHQPTTKQAERPGYQSSTLWVVATAILLPFGIFLAGVGYLFGLAGLWMGTRWRVWEKIMGTVLLPGGFLGAMYISFLPIWNRGPAAGTTGAEVSLGDVMFPGMSFGASIATACVPILVAVYLLVVGLRRGRKLSPARPDMRHN